MIVFLSYTWQDVPLRRAIVAELQHLPGVSRVLFDKMNINASDALHSTISSLIDEANVVIAILTSAGLASKEVSDELVRANERKKRIIPLIEESITLEQLPHFLRDILRIGFTNRNFDRAVDDLTELIGRLSMEPSLGIEEPTRILRSSFAPTTVKEIGNLDLYWLQRSNLGRELLEQVIAMCTVYPFEWDAMDGVKTTPIFISPNTFIPDNWTRSFLKGIISQAKDLKTADTVVEIGVGTGIVPVILAHVGFQFAKYYGFDIDTLATRVASININLHNLGSRTAIRGGGSIFEPERSFDLGENYAALIIANVPQVPSMSTGPIRDLFDYYHMPIGVRGRKYEWAMQGLWLVAEILEQAQSRLTDDGKIILNIGGRPGIDHIICMFSECGYQANIVSSEIIEQDPETDISALVHFERTQDVKYYFYSDEECRAEITARSAYERIADGQKAYHKLYVIQAAK